MGEPQPHTHTMDDLHPPSRHLWVGNLEPNAKEREVHHGLCVCLNLSQPHSPNVSVDLLDVRKVWRGREHQAQERLALRLRQLPHDTRRRVRQARSRRSTTAMQQGACGRQFRQGIVRNPKILTRARSLSLSRCSLSTNTHRRACVDLDIDLDLDLDDLDLGLGISESCAVDRRPRSSHDVGRAATGL